MSATTSTTTAGATHGTLASYVTGFILCLILTGLSFGAVMGGVLPPEKIMGAISGLAVVQLLVQLIVFLHLGLAPEQRNYTVIGALTVLLIATVVIGSLWVMHNANVNMMPTQMSVERALSKD
ncbi:cytochrome o ubiquinol oxidase subunit IV [Nitrospirillum sp. BR 11164]|uniref:cytochrome o ubiquinol oxidase subunit IV n=1 Tax=Nitrospirillum sp. BR 11164 TaxID=3104324 RepID=UPI002AFE7247|nr:cytochrome o ubiquinol oxidase subunit IV [Nitrospirillum sp. BR 11164]MEA1648689.1 cytochrome o ubiquinol oxidase subunit IV [Nitrospirillum sp. BR 11164]